MMSPRSARCSTRLRRAIERTVMNWVLLGGSLVGVLALAGASWMLGLGKADAIDADHAIAIVRERLVGFAPLEALVSSDGLTALVIGENEAALVKRHGVDIALRRLPLPLSITDKGDWAEVTTGESMFGTLRLTLDKEGRDKLLTLV